MKMSDQKSEKFFDQTCASGYDQLQTKLAPLRASLDALTAAILSDLPADARVLCAGAGTGAELIPLARKFPGWRFTAVEPSAPMLEVCRRKVEESGIADRCVLHGGYLDSLPASEEFDAATALLVSHFILDRADRVRFFRGIGKRLRPGGWLVSCDLSADTSSSEYSSLLDVWWNIMKTAEVPPEAFDRMRESYGRDVALLPPGEVQGIISSAGFGRPVQFLQTGLIHGWYARVPA